MHVNYILDLEDGSLKNENGELIWAADIAKDNLECADITRLEIRCPANYSEARFSQVARKLLNIVRKCIRDSITTLVLIRPTNELLKSIDLTGNEKTQINRLSIVEPNNIEWEWITGLPVLKRLNYIGDGEHQFSDIASLTHLHYCGSQLDQFKNADKLKKLFVKIKEAEDFTKVISFLKSKKEVLTTSLQVLQVNYTQREDMPSITEMVQQVLDIQIFPEMTFVEESAGIQFAYDKKLGLLQTNIDALKEQLARFAEKGLVFSSFKELRVMNIVSKDNATELEQLIEKPLEKLWLVGDDVATLRTMFAAHAEWKTIIMQSGHDRISKKKLGKEHGSKHEGYRADVHTNRFLEDIPNNVAELDIYFHGRELNLCIEVASKLLEFKDLQVLFIGSDNRLLSTITTHFDTTNYLLNLKLLNVSIETAEKLYVEDNLLNRMVKLVIRNSDSRNPLINEVKNRIDNRLFENSNWTVAIDAHTSNIIFSSQHPNGVTVNQALSRRILDLAEKLWEHSK